MSKVMLDEQRAMALKLATKALIRACGGGEAAATVCRLQPPSLSEAAGRFHPERFLPLDVVAQLEADAEVSPVTAALAQLAGYVLVPVRARGPGDLPTLLARLGTEVGQVFAASARALGDGVIDDSEREELVRELGEMLVAGQAALSALSPAVPLRRVAA